MTRMIPLATVNAALDNMIVLGVNLSGDNPAYEAGLHRMAEEAAKTRGLLADLAEDPTSAPNPTPTPLTDAERRALEDGWVERDYTGIRLAVESMIAAREAAAYLRGVQATLAALTAGADRG